MRAVPPSQSNGKWNGKSCLLSITLQVDHQVLGCAAGRAPAASYHRAALATARVRQVRSSLSLCVPQLQATIVRQLPLLTYGRCAHHLLRLFQQPLCPEKVWYIDLCNRLRSGTCLCCMPPLCGTCHCSCTAGALIPFILPGFSSRLSLSSRKEGSIFCAGSAAPLAFAS